MSKQNQDLMLDRSQLLNLFDQATSKDELDEESSVFSTDEIDPNLRYEVIELIGKGGMKKVLRVMDTLTDREVALAEPLNLKNDHECDAFLREARLNAQLQHPNIISVHDIGVRDNGSPWFTMALKMGKNLQSKLEQLPNALSWSQEPELLQHFCEIFEKICDAMHYAHDHHIIHLDLKPSNIQLGDHGQVFVCDWGCGRIIEEQHHIECSADQHTTKSDLMGNLTVFGAINGTPGYMAPEQAEMGHTKDTRTDIYALGAVLYSMLALEHPMKGTSEEIRKKTTQGAWEDLGSRYPKRDIPHSLIAIVKKAMSFDRSDRYQNVMELKEDVQKFLTGFATSAERFSLLKEVQLFYCRHRRSCQTILLSSFILLISSIVYSNNLAQTLEELKDSEENVKEQLLKLNLEKKRSEEILQLYRSEKKWLNEMVVKYEDDVKKSIYDFTDVYFFDDPKSSLDNAMEKLDILSAASPKNRFGTSQKGYIHFLRQEYSQAWEAFQIKRIFNRDTEYISEKMAQKYPFYRPVPASAMVENIEIYTQSRNMSVVFKMVIFDSILRQNPKEHAPLVKAMLKLDNPSWRNTIFDYDHVNQALTLGGLGLHRLFFDKVMVHSTGDMQVKKSLLDTLPLKSLNLHAKNQIHEFKFLWNSDLTEVDLCGTMIDHVRQLNKNSSLKRVFISKEQASVMNLHRLRKGIEVIVH